MGVSDSTRRADEEVFEAGDAVVKSVGNGREPKRYGEKCGDAGGPWVTRRVGVVSGFLLPTFLCRCKEK
jgi:hypothetical protein